MSLWMSSCGLSGWRTVKMTDHKKPEKCPECGKSEAIPIVYGYPGPELEERVRRGVAAIGGCCVMPDSPVWLCLACDHRWGRLGEI